MLQQCVAVSSSVLQCAAVSCSVQQCVAVCCSVLQCVAVCCSVLQCVAVCCGVLHCSAVCCSVLQCVVCCSVQCAVCCSELCIAIRTTKKKVIHNMSTSFFLLTIIHVHSPSLFFIFFTSTSLSLFLIREEHSIFFPMQTFFFSCRSIGLSCHKLSAQ